MISKPSVSMVLWLYYSNWGSYYIPWVLLRKSDNIVEFYHMIVAQRLKSQGAQGAITLAVQKYLNFGLQVQTFWTSMSKEGVIRHFHFLYSG